MIGAHLFRGKSEIKDDLKGRPLTYVIAKQVCPEGAVISFIFHPDDKILFLSVTLPCMGDTFVNGYEAKSPYWVEWDDEYDDENVKCERHPNFGSRTIFKLGWSYPLIRHQWLPGFDCYTTIRGGPPIYRAISSKFLEEGLLRGLMTSYMPAGD